MKVQLVKEFVFEAAHRHPGPNGEPGPIHGHSYRACIVVAGEVDHERGWLVDYGDIKKEFEPFYRRLDHQYLNEVDGLTDASRQGVAEWITARLAPRLPGLEAVQVSIEGDCRFRPVSIEPEEAFGWPGRIRFGFEAAHYLPRVPEDHKCRNLHGHSFRVEVGSEPIDGLENHLASLYEALDRTCLNEVPGLENATSENLCRWIWRRLSDPVKGLKVVIVQETCTARCVYRGE